MEGDASIDLLIVGGGINGAGIAREAAGRGLSVLLVEKDDLAAHTSSASSKLIHGGLRYLEQFEFRLVRESLAERKRLLRMAPHIVQPLQFVLPLTGATRPAWMIRAGLILYDRLGGGGCLPSSGSIRLDRNGFGDGLKPGTSRAFTYWDCRVQDSRLVVLNAMSAAERGASIHTRTELVEARRETGSWTARLRGAEGEKTVRPHAIVNAAGPWAGQLFDRLSGLEHRPRVRLVKGSHIVLPRLYTGDHAFILPGPDGRVVFAIPFERRFTLVGTTDVDWSRPVGEPTISDEEVDYLLAVVKRTFTAAVSRSDIAWTYAGIRALVDDGATDASQVTRDYALDLVAGDAPLLTIVGGKLTTYRRLAERAVECLASCFPSKLKPRPADDQLPGGDLPDQDLEGYSRELGQKYPRLPGDLLARMARTYGTRTERVLDAARSTEDLGEDFGAGLTAREVDYLVADEWARNAEDILIRRTKLGLHIPKEGVERLSAYLARG